MIATPQSPAAQLVRLLLGDPRLDPDDLDWSQLLPCADEHQLTLRLAQWFARQGEAPPALAVESIARARRDAADQVARIAGAGAELDARGVAHAFIGVLQQVPDLGRGVGLLVSGPPPDVDTVLFDHVPASLAPFARMLLAQRQSYALGDARCAVPSDEDALLLQALGVTNDAGSVALPALVWALGLVRSARYDGGRLIAAACAMGAMPALRRHLAWLDQVTIRLFGLPLPDARLTSGMDIGVARTTAPRGLRAHA